MGFEGREWTLGLRRCRPRLTMPERAKWHAVVGREEELRVLEELLGTHAPAQGPTAIALEGEAGIGKSTLWREAVEEARGRGLRVLTARPAETERNFAHAGLGDLLDELLPEVLPALAPPQRRALEVTLLVADNGGAPIDPRTLGVAVRSTLQALAEDGLVLAIDDLQWLDAPSARALAFAVRRLPEARVLLLWTRRLDGQRTPSPLEEALDPDHVHVVPLGSLSVGAVHRIIVSRYGKPVPRPTLLRLHEVSGGNPFYALELARALDSEDGRRDPTQPLPVPERLEELLAARLRTFTSATHDALVLAATDARLTPTQLRAAGIEPAALDPALVEGIVELADGIVRFTHPLLASVLYQALAPGERRQAHRRLAEVADEPLARARHLALSADEPDGELAAELERAASAAADHGTPIVAAELGEHALRLTPPNDRHGADRRAAATARAHLAAGEPVRARALAAELLARASPGAERARALVLTADVEADIQRTIALLQQALEEAEGEPALQAEIHGKLCLPIRFTSGLSVAERHARAALALANDDALRASARGSLALIRFNSGKPGSLRLAEEAYELASALGNAELAVDAAFALAHVLFWSYELNRARALLEHLDAVWSDRNERLSASALWYLALVEVRAGRLALASEYAQRSRAIVQQYGREEDESPQDLFPLMLVAAHRGELDRAHELTLVSLQRADRHAARLRAPHANAGFVELWRGDAAAAVERFADAEQVVGAGDGGDPGMTWWRAEQIEALLALGRVDDAVERLDAWEADARRLRRRWVVAHATRCRGLVASARGDLDGALSLLADAASQHEAVGDPFGRGRALLALGVVRRRAKQKRASREALEAAAAAFDDMGAAGWAARARAELGSIGGRTRTDGLTKSERRVADLVAQGRTNAEVAAALFLAERTVASHLTHIYAKLGIRSRTELARKLG
jgi:DNA-binding CsgD family transcriptional regulator